MTTSVTLTKVIVVWPDPLVEFPYNILIQGVNNADGTPVSTTGVATGAFDTGTTIDGILSDADWDVTN